MRIQTSQITKLAWTASLVSGFALAATLLLAVPAFADTDISPLDEGIDEAITDLCDITVAEGDNLLDAQADMVGDNLEALTEKSDEAQKTDQTATTQTGATATNSARGTVAGPSTINIDGVSMSYIDYFDAASAPETGAGLWKGSDSTTDGTWGYFIGHNPGPFWHVMDLTNGDAVTVTDRNGATRSYHVVDTFTVSDSTYWEEIENRVDGYGESVILQTCVGDHAHYRIVVADAD